MFRVRTLAALCGVCILLAVLWFLVPLWGTRLTEIDFSSARLRERTFVFGICVRDKQIDTDFSRLVSKYVPDIPPAHYEPVSIRPIGLKRIVGLQLNVRPYRPKDYGYGAALWPLRLFAEVLADAHLGKEREAELVLHMLGLFREMRVVDGGGSREKLKEMDRCIRGLLSSLPNTSSQDGRRTEGGVSASE